jgi:uncharacterized protein YqjF (DUF2071 family)
VCDYLFLSLAKKVSGLLGEWEKQMSVASIKSGDLRFFFFLAYTQILLLKSPLRVRMTSSFSCVKASRSSLQYWLRHNVNV